jgi:hypothetical protein
MAAGIAGLFVVTKVPLEAGGGREAPRPERDYTRAAARRVPRNDSHFL